MAAIFALKGRPSDHPLIVHVHHAAAANAFAAQVPDFAQRLMDAFWPGPLTLILPRRAGVAQAAAGGQGSIGLRCPAHPLAQALLRDCAQAGIWGLAAPSANRFGRVSPTTAEHVRQGFGPDLLVLDGGPARWASSPLWWTARAASRGAAPRRHHPRASGQSPGSRHACPGAPAAAAPRALGYAASALRANAKVRLMDAQVCKPRWTCYCAAHGRGVDQSHAAPAVAVWAQRAAPPPDQSHSAAAAHATHAHGGSCNCLPPAGLMRSPCPWWVEAPPDTPVGGRTRPLAARSGGRANCSHRASGVGQVFTGRIGGVQLHGQYSPAPGLLVTV